MYSTLFCYALYFVLLFRAPKMMVTTNKSLFSSLLICMHTTRFNLSYEGTEDEKTNDEATRVKKTEQNRGRLINCFPFLCPHVHRFSV